MRSKVLLAAVVIVTAACSEELVTAPEVAEHEARVDTAKAFVRVRVAGSDSLPLIIVDGVAVRVGSDGLRDSSRDDIEAIEILKSASAATLYGTGTNCPAIVIKTRAP